MVLATGQIVLTWDLTTLCICVCIIMVVGIETLTAFFRDSGSGVHSDGSIGYTDGLTITSIKTNITLPI